jgi:hypothetical protein
VNRAERLAARRDRGLARPGPVRTRTVNLASVSSRPTKVREILSASIRSTPLPDLILATECSDLTIRNFVDEGVWQVIQFGRSISDDNERIARSGCALLARRSVVKLDKPRLDLGSPAGEGIRARYVLSARATFHKGQPSAWRAWVRVGHAPPGRAPIGRGRFLAALRGLTGIRAGDYNVSSSTARRTFVLAKVKSAGVLHIVIPRWIRTAEPERLDVGSDHRALDVTLWPRRGDAEA